MDVRKMSKGVLCEMDPAQYTVRAIDKSEA
jgi:hypothetical protein